MSKTKKKVTKERVTICLDSDIIAHFKQRARLPNTKAYQTQINDALRAVMEGTASGPYASLVDDPSFIAAVAERLGQLHGRKGK